MTDNPFSESDDSDRTIIRPAPGGRRPATPAARAPTSADVNPFAAGPARPPANAIFDGPSAPAAVAEAPETFDMGGSPLLTAASPLLQLLARLRNTASQPNAGELRERAVQEVRKFEQAGLAANIPIEQMKFAHYALCASIDDVVMDTPWGAEGIWSQYSLGSTFHRDVRSGERFFDLLRQLRQNPGANLPVMELMYICLSLGYMGGYRLRPNGRAEIDRLREDAYTAIVRSRGAIEAGLSPHWQGIDAAYRPNRFHIPVWLAAVAALGLLALLYGIFAFSLGRASDAAFQAEVAAPPAFMPNINRSEPPAPPVEPTPSAPGILDRLNAFLAPEVAAGKVTVLGTNFAPIVRINNLGLFGSGSAVVESSAIPLLQKIGSALANETGAVTVTGFTDNQPIATLQFPSNFDLSQARAATAASILSQTMGDASRITAKGMGDADPVADNGTAQGRAQNRRIEILLNHPAGN
jgi:type VI secretion system protein ImpK